MTNQSNAAAERSVHIIRGGREVLAACPVVQLPGGKWQLKAIVERDAEIEKLRAALQWLLNDLEDYPASARPLAAYDNARAVLGEKE